GAGLPTLGARVLDSTACAPGVAVLRSGVLPNVRELCEPVQILVERTYANGLAGLCLASLPVGATALVAVPFPPNLPLSRKNAMQQLAEERVPEVHSGSRDDD